MTVAYFDCFSGISGDMTLGALLDCGAERAVLDAAVEALRLQDEVALEVGREARGHSGGVRVNVAIRREKERTMPALRAAIEDSTVPDPVKAHALRAINLLGAAESAVHGVPDEHLHLHELGGADTLVDIVGSFWLLGSLGVERVFASPLPAPRGRKGGMPLPAPASVKVLEGTGAVLEPAETDHELVTPTGAAILAAAATFTRPALTLERIGYGAGARDTPGNLLAVWLGEMVEAATGATLIETNVDDMAPNLVAALVEDLMSAGALDVTVTPVLMKKGRPGHAIGVMAPPALAGSLTDHLLRHSTTLGARLSRTDRVLAERREIEVTTRLGVARVKVKVLQGRVVDATPEYEDCRRIARESGTDLRDVMRLVAEAARRELSLT